MKKDKDFWNIVVSREIKKKIKIVAFEDGISCSEIIEKCLNEYLLSKQTRPSRTE